MVSPRKSKTKSVNEATIVVLNRLERYCFYLDIKNYSIAKKLESRIKKLGGRVEVFLCATVTHVISDQPAQGPCATRGPFAPASALSAPSTSRDNKFAAEGVAGRGSVGVGRRADAMLERVRGSAQHDRSELRPALKLPIWTIERALWFLDKVCASLQKTVRPTVKILNGAYIKFEPFDRTNRPVFKEFTEWPQIDLSKKEANCTYMPHQGKKSVQIGNTKSSNSRTSQNSQSTLLGEKKYQGTEDKSVKNRMTRKSKQRKDKNTLQATKQSGYCEICRADYDNLSDHGKSQSHINFSRNGANFLTLDSLISAGADVEAFLKLNKSGMVCEKKSHRNMMKFRQDSEERKELEVICNGGSDHALKHFSPRESNKRQSYERTAKSQVSPALSTDSGHYLRSKGVSNEVSPKDSEKREILQNGNTSPQSIKNDSESIKKVNGKLDDSFRNNKIKNPRSIRWRRPSPESTPQLADTRPYYKVVGMTTKLRSSSSFQVTQPKDASSNRTTCNGDSPLVVKFRRVRRSELSVLSDEAENFMFPKKDDSETEDDAESSKSATKCVSSEILTSESPRSTRVSRLKDIIVSDEDTRDSSGSEFTMTPRKGKRRTKKQIVNTPQRRPYRKRSGSKSPTSAKRKKTESVLAVQEELPIPLIAEPKLKPDSKDRCYKWEDGQLKFSPKVENLKFSFERVPENGSWYDAFIGQYQKLNLKDVGRCFYAYRKQKVLPFQKINLPPLKPGCCKLNQIQKKTTEPKSIPLAGPSRTYGTRGMKKRRSRVFKDGRPRKSPREHASTLAILGGMIHKRKSKFTSDDSKSLPPVLEEDSSNEVAFQQQEHFSVKEFSVKETSKKLEEFLSSVYDDVAEYDVPFENVDNDIRIDANSSKPDILDLLTTYDNCDVIDKTVRQLQENAAESKSKFRKGFKMKKKNRTGWPKKKKVPRRETDNRSNADSVSQDEDAANADEQGGVDIECDDNTMDVSVKSDNYSVNKCVKSSRLGLGSNENSIMSSISDLDDKATDSSKGKEDAEAECSNSEDDTHANSVNVDLKQWESAERSLSDRVSEENSSDEKTLLELQRKVKYNYQPVVRVQKIESVSLPSRRLRSATVEPVGRNRLSPRKLRPSRGCWYR